MHSREKDSIDGIISCVATLIALLVMVTTKTGVILLFVGNQQKWDTFVKERSGGCGSIVGLPALPVVAFAPL